MSVHLQSDLNDLHRDLLSMCASVEDMIHRAVAQLSNPNIDEVRELIEQDTDIDRWDVRVEENCLKILALHQPVAIDLRRITAVLKISGELERVADIACNIAERACGLLDAPQVTVTAPAASLILMGVGHWISPAAQPLGRFHSSEVGNPVPALSQ